MSLQYDLGSRVETMAQYGTVWLDSLVLLHLSLLLQKNRHEDDAPTALPAVFRTWTL